MLFVGWLASRLGWELDPSEIEGRSHRGPRRRAERRGPGAGGRARRVAPASRRPSCGCPGWRGCACAAARGCGSSWIADQEACTRAAATATAPSARGRCWAPRAARAASSARASARRCCATPPTCRRCARPRRCSRRRQPVMTQLTTPRGRRGRGPARGAADRARASTARGARGGSRTWRSAAARRRGAPMSCWRASWRDWDGVEVWFADERCVGPEDEESNYRLARETLLRRGRHPGRADPPHGGRAGPRAGSRALCAGAARASSRGGRRRGCAAGTIDESARCPRST